MSSEPDDLLSKADALMARHRPPRTAAEPDTEIPVLDEVVELPPDTNDLPLLTELVELDRVEPGLPHEQQSEALAACIRAALLARLQPEIDALIEARLKQDLAPIIERLFDDLRGDLQLIARDILGDAINTAVEQEIKRRESGD